MSEVESELFSELHESVGYCYLNRPSVHNAISRQMWDLLPSEFDSLKKRGAKVIIVSGRGSSFAAGADFRELAQIKDYAQARENWNSIANCLKAITTFPLPTIAMIRGNCMGGGLLLALACDLRYAADDANFALPVAKLGIVLDDDNIQRLVSLVGVACAKEILYLARTLSAQKAVQIKLINNCASEMQLEELVKQVAHDIINNACSSIEQAKLSCSRIVDRKNAQDESTVVSSYLSEEFRARLELLG